MAFTRNSPDQKRRYVHNTLVQHSVVQLEITKFIKRNIIKKSKFNKESPDERASKTP